MTIGQRFAETVERHSSELAVVDGEMRITYGQLSKEIAIKAQHLRDTFRLEPGCATAASLPNGLRLIAAFFAVNESGATFLPVNPRMHPTELKTLLTRLNVRGLINSGNEESFDPGVTEHRSPGTAAYLTTSGSTGVPRIVPRSHANLISAAENAARALAIGPGHRFLSVIPFHHSNGFHNSMVLPLLAGACVVTLPNFTPAACAELIARERTDVLIASPYIYSCLADRDLAYVPQTCISGGARMPAALAKRWFDRFQVRVRQLYGSTETSVISIDQGNADPSPGSRGTFVGTPIDGVDVKCIGPAGEIAVRSPAVMSGYVGEPQHNAALFDKGFFLTGDLGSIDSEGNLYLTGRSRRVINLAGIKVDPAELELVLEALPGVDACFVDGQPGGREGEVIRARIVVGPGAQITRGQVLEQCRSRLAEYKLPRIIEFLDAPPTSISGKTSLF